MKKIKHSIWRGTVIPPELRAERLGQKISFYPAKMVALDRGWQGTNQGKSGKTIGADITTALGNTRPRNRSALGFGVLALISRGLRRGIIFHTFFKGTNPLA